MELIRRNDRKEKFLWLPSALREDELPFQLDNIFGWLQILSKTKEGWKLTGDILNMIDVSTTQAKCENPTLVLNISTAKGNFPLQYCSLLEACSWLVLRSNSRGKFVLFTRCRCDFFLNAAIWNWTLPTWSYLPMIHFYHKMPKNKNNSFALFREVGQTGSWCT